MYTEIKVIFTCTEFKIIVKASMLTDTSLWLLSCQLELPQQQLYLLHSIYLYEAFAQGIASVTGSTLFFGAHFNNIQTLNALRKQTRLFALSHAFVCQYQLRKKTRTWAVLLNICVWYENRVGCCTNTKGSPGSDFSEKPDHCHYWG